MLCGSIVQSNPEDEACFSCSSQNKHLKQTAETKWYSSVKHKMG